MLYVSDSYGSAFHQGVVEAALARPEGERMKVEGSSFSYNSDMAILSRDIELQVQQLAQSGYRYFFGCFYDEHYELVMEAAYRYGIVGPGYVWIMSDGLGNTFLDGRTYRAGSPLAIASQGVGILKAEGGRPTVEGNSGYDRFTKAWYEQGAENVEYYNCKQPTTNTMEDPSIYFKAPPDFFTGEKPLAPTAGAVFAYDSAIALGLAACQLYQERGEAYFDGPEFFDAFVSQEFEGASGKVSIDPETGSRDPKSAFFVLYNTNGASDGEGGTIFTVKTVSHSAPNPNNETETSSDSVVHWASYDNEQYLYSDGTQYAPDSLPPPNEELNQLSPGIRATGLTVCGLVFALAVFFGVWTKLNCKKRVIKASQPEFLYMICLGVITLASTLVPLSYDDGVASAEGCDLACMSIPWLFNYGFTTVFSGLFVKTLRLNKIMENAAGGKKMKVTKREVLQYYFAILMVNTIVLVIWTKIDPLTWTRIETGVYDNLGRSADSYGVCKSNNIIPYIVVLFIVNFSTVILANYQSYRARNLSTEFSESKYISIIMASVFQTIVIGMPLYILVAKDPMASYIVLTCIIGALCLMTLVLLFIPKMRAVKKDERARLEEEAGQTSDETEGIDTEGVVEVERISLTHVKADVDDGENEDNEGGENTSEGENTSGSFWGRASALFYGGDPEKGEEGKGKSDEEVFMSSKSIFVGTLVRRDS